MALPIFTKTRIYLLKYQNVKLLSATTKRFFDFRMHCPSLCVYFLYMISLYLKYDRLMIKEK